MSSPETISPAVPDLPALARTVTWEHYGRRTLPAGWTGYQATCGCGWESASAAKRDEADALHSAHLADEVRAALLSVHRDAVLEEAAQMILDHADEHFPADGNDEQERMRRHLRIAARVVTPEWRRHLAATGPADGPTSRTA